MPLLAEPRDDICDLGFRRRVDEIGSRVAGNIHAHVEGTVGPKGKSAIGLVELERGDAEIEHNAVAAALALFGEEPVDLREPPMYKREAVGIVAPEGVATRNRLGIAIDGDHAATGAFEKCAGMTAAAK